MCFANLFALFFLLVFIHKYFQVTFWNNVYGFDMSALGREAVRRGRGLGAKPEVMVLGPDQILAAALLLDQLQVSEG